MNNKLNILHVVGGTSKGGAAKGATNLHKAMLRDNMNSFIIYGYAERDDIKSTSNVLNKRSFINYVMYRFNIFLDRLALSLYPKRKNLIFSTGFFGFNLNRIINLYSIDVVNLHWINHGMLSLNKLYKIDKPIVWTLRDAWPFTGGCHIPIECNNFTKSCGKCPQLSSKNETDLSRYIFNKKKRNYRKIKNIQFVSISRYLKNQAEKSPIINQKVIPITNLVDFENLKAIDTLKSKNELKLSNKKTILFQNNTGELWKGSQYVNEIVELLADQYQFISYGLGEGYKNVKNLGYAKDKEMLSLIYSATDLFIFLSEQEPFGKALFEAAWCGAHVACFKNGGTYEFFNSEKWWSILMSKNPKDIVSKIHKILSKKESNLKSIQRDLLNKINEKKIVSEYRKIYQNLI